MSSINEVFQSIAYEIRESNKPLYPAEIIENILIKHYGSREKVLDDVLSIFHDDKHQGNIITVETKYYEGTNWFELEKYEDLGIDFQSNNLNGNLILELSNILDDYRSNENLNPKPINIENWVKQFSSENQKIILEELINILNKLYFSEEKIDNLFTKIIENNKLVGENPINFWNNISLLEIQTNGNSQKIINKKFINFVENKISVKLEINNDEKNHFIYLDDFLFSGNRLRTDLNNWFKSIKKDNILDVIYIGCYKSGYYYTSTKWMSENKPKNSKVRIWRYKKLENNTNCQNSSHILWPTTKSVEENSIIQDYLDKQEKYILRDTNQRSSYHCENSIFSSEKNRVILEKEFTLAGLKIIDSIQDEEKRKKWKPLGVSSFTGLGFGGMVFTYRNCPNNSPLAIWWGDWNDNKVWYPLLQRKTYSN